MSGDDSDGLGYCHPPVWSRFRPGVSGNPKGRPRKTRDTASLAPSPSAQDDSLRRQLSEPTAIRTAKGSKTISRLEAILMAQQKSALEGNVVAQRDLIREARALEERDHQRKEAEEKERREVFYRMRDFRTLRVRVWADAERLGQEPSDPWPHPDDLILNERSHDWSVRGPIDEQDIPHYRYLEAERDWHFVMMILHGRTGRTKAERKFGTAIHCLWAVFDAQLPKRWQINDQGLDNRIVSFFDLPIAVLKRDVARLDAKRRALQPRPSDTRRDRDTYKFVNKLMKPFLKRNGYRSLAEFEHAYETLGPDMPWPK